MNVCAARTEVVVGAWKQPRLVHLPHEPKSEHRFRLDLVHQPGSMGNFAECEHCGSIYAVDSE